MRSTRCAGECRSARGTYYGGVVTGDFPVTPGAPNLKPELFSACPLPQSRYDRILLGHGSGGLLTAQLIHNVFLPGFGNSTLSALEDQATLSLNGKHNGAAGRRIAFTTDSFVVRPLFFPGGDIGK